MQLSVINEGLSLMGRDLTIIPRGLLTPVHSHGPQGHSTSEWLCFYQP